MKASRFGTLSIVKLDNGVDFSLVTFAVDSSNSTFFLDVHQLASIRSNVEMSDFIQRQRNFAILLYKIETNRVICNENFLIEAQPRLDFHQFMENFFKNEKETLACFSYTSISHVIDSWVDEKFRDEEEKFKEISTKVASVLEYFNQPQWKSDLMEAGVELCPVSEGKLIEKSKEFGCFLDNYKKLKTIYASVENDAIHDISFVLFDKKLIEGVKDLQSTMKIFKEFRDGIESGLFVSDVVDKFFELQIDNIVTRSQMNDFLNTNTLLSYLLDPKFKRNRLPPEMIGNLRTKLIKPLMRTRVPGTQSELQYLSQYLKGDGFFAIGEVGDLKNNPVDFWTNCESNCPNLSKLALQHCCLPGSVFEFQEIMGKSMIEVMKRTGDDFPDEATAKLYYRCYYSLNS